MADLKLFLQILANASGLKREMSDSGNAVTRFTSGAKREFDSLRGSLGSIQGKLAGLGLSIGALQQLSQSARLDKGLTQVGQTAGQGREMVKGLRQEFFQMGRETGQQVEGLKEGFDGLIQSGQSWKAALESTKGINIASAVTGAQGSVLAGGLTVGATAFNIDLEKPGKALELLDKMTVAGRLGNAELQNLSDIFARVGVNAASAGMGYDKTLAFIEGLSMVERQPERLATLADSTLRLFTNLRYTAEAQKGTGVKFFDAKGARRDAVDVLQDIKKKWDVLKTDKARAIFIQQAFGKADLDTIKGMKTLLSGDALSKIREFTRQIGNAGGTLQKDLPEAISNAIDQTGRLKITMRKAADEFAQPINKALSDLIRWGLNDKNKGGLALSGKEIALGGGGAILAALIAKRYGGKALSALTGGLLAKGSNTAIGVAEGKVLEEVAGVKPVFVTNWPSGGVGGGGSPFIGAGAGAAGGAAAGAGASLSGIGLAGSIGPLFAGMVGAGSIAVGDAVARWQAGQMSWNALEKTQRTLEVIGGGKNGVITDEMATRYQSTRWQSLFDDTNHLPLPSRGGPVKNDIKIEVHFDELGRVITKVNDMKTRTDVKSLNRGSLWDALWNTEGM
jgi:TP901 family phage tail tape measure protein